MKRFANDGKDSLQEEDGLETLSVFSLTTSALFLSTLDTTFFSTSIVSGLTFFIEDFT